MVLRYELDNGGDLRSLEALLGVFPVRQVKHRALNLLVVEIEQQRHVVLVGEPLSLKVAVYRWKDARPRQAGDSQYRKKRVSYPRQIPTL